MRNLIDNIRKSGVVPVVYAEGDGIGPEVVQAAKKVGDAALSKANGNLRFDWIEASLGQRALELHNNPLPQKSIDLIRDVQLAIKGPTETKVGKGHRSINVGLRQELDLYANIRPITPFEGLTNPVPAASNVNLVIFRENTEDVYSGIEFKADSTQARELAKFLKKQLGVDIEQNGVGLGIKPISEAASRRITKKAVEFAIADGRNRVTIVHKGNIMKFTEGAFNEWAYAEAREILGDKLITTKELPVDGKIPRGRILVEDIIADNMFQQLILEPAKYQVLVATNLNGDYLSDAAAALVGGLGFASGINQGDRIVLAEAVHGTAPDIAGLNKANPTAAIFSLVGLLKAIELNEPAAMIETAVRACIKSGIVTGDLRKRLQTPTVVGTSEFADAVIEML